MTFISIRVLRIKPESLDRSLCIDKTLAITFFDVVVRLRVAALLDGGLIIFGRANKLDFLHPVIGSIFAKCFFIVALTG